MGRYHGSDQDHEQQPLTWLNGHAIYAAHLIVVVYVVSMLVCTLMLAFNGGHLLQWLVFQSDAVLRGQVWRIFTYGLVNPPGFGFVIDMFVIVWFGRELEKFFGRSLFLRFYACLYFLPPLAYTLLGLWLPMSLSGEVGGFALFIAFATLYPNVALFFGITAKWLAFIAVGIETLVYLAYHMWFPLGALWITVGFAFGFVRYEQGLITLPSFRLFRRKPKLRVLPDLPDRERGEAMPVPAAPVDSSMAEIDALLDKIAQSGLHSLTAKERAKLEKGRENLLKRGR